MAQTIGRRCSTFFYRRACLMLPAFPAVADLQGRAASLGWTASRAATPTATAGRPGWRCVRQGCCWALVHAVPASHAGSPAQQLQRRHSAGTCGATLACLPAPSHVPSPAWHVPCHTACCRHQTPPNTTKRHLPCRWGASGCTPPLPMMSAPSSSLSAQPMMQVRELILMLMLDS